MKVSPGDEDNTCYTCRVIHRKTVTGEVLYEKDKYWMCLKCHLTERKPKGKGKVNEILETCTGCDGIPCLFCYDCSQFLCEKCEKCKKRAEGEDCVSHCCKM